MFLVNVPRNTSDFKRSEEILKERKITIPQLSFLGTPEEQVEKYRVFNYPTVLIIKNNEIIHVGNIHPASKRLKDLFKS